MSQQNDTFFWWKNDDKDIHKTVFQHLAFLVKHQGHVHHQNLKNMRLYGNFENFGNLLFEDASRTTSNSLRNRVTFNVVQSMVDTVVSKITKNKPKATFLTEGGNWSLQNRAKKLTQFIEGQFHSTEYYDKSAMAFLDACIFGTGAVKLFVQENEIQADRIFIDEIVVDDAESIYGKPRQMHQRKWMHRDVLKEMFPDKAKEIDDAGSNTQETGCLLYKF